MLFHFRSMARTTRRLLVEVYWSTISPGWCAFVPAPRAFADDDDAIRWARIFQSLTSSSLISWRCASLSRIFRGLIVVREGLGFCCKIGTSRWFDASWSDEFLSQRGFSSLRSLLCDARRCQFRFFWLISIPESAFHGDKNRRDIGFLPAGLLRTLRKTHTQTAPRLKSLAIGARKSDALICIWSQLIGLVGALSWFLQPATPGAFAWAWGDFAPARSFLVKYVHWPRAVLRRRETEIRRRVQ